MVFTTKFNKASNESAETLGSGMKPPCRRFTPTEENSFYEYNN